MSKYKIWFQGATDRVHMAPYLSKLEPHLKAILDPDFSFVFNTTTPPATTTHALTEFRIGRSLIRAAVVHQCRKTPHGRALQAGKHAAQRVQREHAGLFTRRSGRRGGE